MLVTCNAIKKKPIVVNDKIEIREVIIINCTFDHRFLDGARSKKLNDLVNIKKFLIFFTKNKFIFKKIFFCKTTQFLGIRYF